MCFPRGGCRGHQSRSSSLAGHRRKSCRLPSTAKRRPSRRCSVSGPAGARHQHCVVRHQHCVVTYGSCNTENHRRLRGKECDVVAQRTSESSGAWKTLQGVQVGGWNVQGTNVDQQGRSGAARVERLAQRPLAGCSCQRKKCGGSRAIPCPCLGCRVPPW